MPDECNMFTDDGHLYNVHLFDGDQLDGLMRAANAGNTTARRVMLAFVAWSRSADKAETTEHPTRCFGCDEPIKHHDLAAFAAILPNDNGRVGLTAGLCGHCRDHLSYEETMARLDAAVLSQFGLESHSLQ